MNLHLPSIVSKPPRPFPAPAKETYAYFLANASHTRAAVEALGMSAAPPKQRPPAPPSNKRGIPRNALLALISQAPPPPPAPPPDLPPPPA